MEEKVDGIKICVILVNYNGKAYNDRCIISLLKSTISDQLQIVVVDNGSTDGSFQELREKWESHGQIHLIGLGDNFGFSRANNVGIRWAMEQQISYYLLLNNDTEIAPEAIENMLICHKKTGGIVAPKIYYADRPEVIWCAGGEFSKILKKSSHRGLNQKEQGQFGRSGRCGFANGCCMLLSREHIETLGFLNEQFFLYYEDNEYSLRAAVKGIPVWYCADSIVYHKVNGATRGNEKPANGYYITRNWLMCSHMYMSKARFLVFCFYFGLNRLAWAVIWTAQGKKGMVKAMKAGISDFCKGRTGRFEEREFL